jgi:5-methyltetrahydrofolate--homocysteine methyltransferase
MSRLHTEFDTKYLAAATSRYIVSTTDLGGTYDILAALRGTQRLLFDLIEYPEEVKRFAFEQIEPLWKTFFMEHTDRLFAAQGAYSSWMPVYSEKRYYPLQCDFSAMISPAMFEEFILPDLKWQTEMLERSIYHLDGPGEIPHLDLLLSLPRLNAIQWVPGDGKAPVTDPCWFDMYDRIQRAGKGLVLLGVNPDEMEPMLNHISPKGVYMCMSAKDIKQAEEIVRLVNAKGAR